MPFSIVTFPAN